MTLHRFLQELDERKIYYDHARHRGKTIMVKVAVPGERWEVEFFEDGTVEVEVFRSIENGLADWKAIEWLFREFSD